MSLEREMVMVWAPSGRDGAQIVALLARHGIPARVFAATSELAAALDDTGCALIAEEALGQDELAALEEAQRRQPAWSDFPFIVLALPTAPGRPAAGSWPTLGNVTVLERPTRSRMLLTAVGSALRARRRQHEAQQAIQHRDQFLAMLGHELRNPLAAISLATEAERLRVCTDGEEPLAQRGHDIIARQARHLSRLVDALLDVASVTTGKVVLDPAVLDLNLVLARSLQNQALSASASQVELTHAPWPEPLLVHGDAVRLEEVIGNLLSNAIKYSPPHASVQVSLRPEGASAVMRVEDRGAGISGEMLPRVFELFAQGEVSLDRSRGGLGVGLTLVKSLVELHGGHVSAESAGLGKGSSFSVTLPLLDESVEPSAPSSRGVPSRPLPVSVLLVDDNDDLLEMTKAVLEGFGCNVSTARDGPSGLRRLNQLRPQLAFIDIGLPGLDGYSLARAVRSSVSDGPWLVALTGYGQPEDRERALAAGFDRHLTKPVSISALRRAVEEASQTRPAEIGQGGPGNAGSTLDTH